MDFFKFRIYYDMNTSAQSANTSADKVITGLGDYTEGASIRVTRLKIQ
jgi:hypothetical protein